MAMRNIISSFSECRKILNPRQTTHHILLVKSFWLSLTFIFIYLDAVVCGFAMESRNVSIKDDFVCSLLQKRPDEITFNQDPGVKAFKCGSYCL